MLQSLLLAEGEEGVIALGLGSGLHVCSGSGVNARVSGLGFLHFIRRKRRRLRVRMSTPRYSCHVIVLYGCGVVSVVSELELSGVPGMRLVRNLSSVLYSHNFTTYSSRIEPTVP